MRVLNLVTTPRPFFNDQCESLRRLGIEVDTVQVPKRTPPTESRSITDYLRFYPTVAKRAFRDQYDLVHANFGNTVPFAFGQPRRPIVATLWGSDVMQKDERIRKVNTWFARECDAVVLPSERMTDYYPYEYEYIPFGVDPRKFYPISKSQARKQVGWDEDKTIVLFPYPGEREVKKLDVAQEVVSRADDDAVIKTLQGVPHAEVFQYMNAADALLVTSRRESGPMVVKEAALCNVPVVSTDVGFVSEVLSDIKNSYVCESKSELVNRLREVLRGRVRSDGRKHVGEWRLERMAERYVDVYHAALDRSG
jgi:glycosyltransferase involved in cell wall biosynthesis